MFVPAIRGVIARRLLVNYRIDPDHLSNVLPDPFEPLLVDGYGIGGICLIRLTEVDHVFSSFFEDTERFLRGSIQFDDALLMQNIDHEWRAQESLYCSGVPEARNA